MLDTILAPVEKSFPSITDQSFCINNEMLFLLGDPHLGRRFVNGVPLARRGEREAMMLRDFSHYFQVVAMHQPEWAICMGDVFDGEEVPPTLVDFVFKEYKAAIEASPQTRFVLIMGNHDGTRTIGRVTSFDILAILLQHIGVYVVRDDAYLISNGTNTFLFCPWHPTKTSHELTAEFVNQKVDAAFGHWDVVAPEDKHNVIPYAHLDTHLIFTGHDHSRRVVDMGHWQVYVTGSMQPYKHGEDWTGTIYRTVTMAELEMISAEDRRMSCIRVKLAAGETPPVFDALHISFMPITATEGETRIDVSLGGLDMAKLWDECFDEAGVGSELQATLWERFRLR